jgi:protein SCO1
MKYRALVCGLLLHVLLIPVLAQAQDLAPIDSDTPEASAFDYDQALAFSQAAIGTTLSNVEFASADGRNRTLAEFRGKPLVLSMIYTSCHQICPMTTRHLSEVVEKARDALGENSFAVAVVGFDVPVDTPDAMQYFANKQGIGNSNWHLLSVRANSVDRLARDTGFLYFPSSAGFDHLIQATVIDAEGKVYRQVYGQVFDTPLLVDPLIELVLGRSPPEQPLLDNLVSKIKLFCTTYDPLRDGYFFDYSLFIGMLIGGSIIIIALIATVRGMNSRQA